MPSKQGRKIYDIDADKDITLDSTHFDTDPDMFKVHDLHGDEVFVETEEPVENTRAITITQGKNKNTKLKAITTTTTAGILLQEPSETRTTTTTTIPSKDKGKVIMKKKNKLRLAREKAEKDEEANISIAECASNDKA
ncbi:hypothetical protein Tco_1367518 [Tanacetum coccineum]